MLSFTVEGSNVSSQTLCTCGNVNDIKPRFNLNPGYPTPLRPHHGDLHAPTQARVQQSVCPNCAASEETGISDHLPGAGAKLKPKSDPTCEEWQRIFPLARGGNVVDGSGDIAPAALHQTCMGTTSPFDSSNSSDGARGTRQHRPRSQVQPTAWNNRLHNLHSMAFWTQSGYSQALVPTGTPAHFQDSRPKGATVRDRHPLHRSSPFGRTPTFPPSPLHPLCRA